ncbi:MAG: hypothetical protein O2887_18575 [Bacteroidetes bacterium]|nr:hypothetical protein [Bacteroidota bacterium]
MKFLLFSTLVFITSCASKVQEKGGAISSIPSLSTPVAHSLILDEIVIIEEYEKVGADVFGDFHNDSFRLFTKENPEVEIEGVNVNSLIFYYIDEDLLQKRYELTDDVTTKLIKANGKFKIRGLNLRNIELINEHKSGLLVDHEIIPEIDFYQLRWEKGEDEIIYQVRRDTIEIFYT